MEMFDSVGQIQIDHALAMVYLYSKRHINPLMFDVIGDKPEA